MMQAGLGTRTIHFLVDVGIAFVLSIIAHRIWVFYVVYYRFPVVSYSWFFYLWMGLYPLLMELFTLRTAGKYITMCRVVNMQGGTPAIWQILLRSLGRMPLFLDPFFMLLPGGRTLHDRISFTRVITSDVLAESQSV